MADTPFHWKRFWFPAGSQVSLIDGYLPDPEGRMGPYLALTGIELRSLSEVPCLVLLGIPGMGKTSEMTLAADDAKKADQLVDVISLARLTGPTELQSRLVGSEHHVLWKQGSRVWNIYLDGLDEALAQLSQIETAIPDLIRQLAGGSNQLNALRLRISCRSAEWPQTLEGELRGIWDADNVKVYELGHLREKDVRSAAAQLFPSTLLQDQFVNYVREHEAQPLASRPITLKMLLNVFKQEASLPRHQVELYRKGLLASVEEANEIRRSNRQTWWLDTRSKLMVAARIAACTIFSNSFEIWTGHQSQVPPERAIVLSEIAGGYEPSLNSSFSVGEAELRETLLTSLFVPLRSLLFGWAHQTFAEFLAAYYLLEHGLTAEEALRFFQVSDETSHQIAPQLTEVAAWLASMQPEFFRALVRADPAVLLRSDVAAAAPDDRETLVGELLRRVDNEELHDFQLDFRTRYGRLGHARLSEQLRPYIFGKGKNRVVRRVAIDIAEANKLDEIATALSDIALDVTDDIHIRSQAAHAIAVSSETSAKAKLRPLLEGDQPEDVDDELKGYALQALWPDQLSVNELLPILTPPKRSNLIGAYYYFLSELQLPSLSESEALTALQWSIQNLPTAAEARPPFDRLCSHFLSRAFEATDNHSVRERFADFLLTAIRDGSFWSFDEQFRKSLSESVLSDKSPQLRRNLVVSIINRAATRNEQEWPLLLGGSNPLVTPHDLAWLVELLKSPIRDEARRLLIQLIVGQTFAQKLDDLSFVWDAGAEFPTLAEALTQAYSVDLSSAVARWQRDDLERQKTRRADEEQREQTDMAALLKRELEKIESNGSSNWWQLHMLLFAHANGRLDPNAEFQSDLRKSRGWQLVSEGLRRRIVLSGLRYLKENLVSSKPWIGRNTFNRRAAAGYRAFRLLMSEDQSLYLQLHKRVWRKWTASILGVSFNEDIEDREARRQIIQRCIELVPEQVLLVVKRLILKASEYDVQTLLSSMSANSDERLDNALWQFLSTIDAGDARAKPIIRFLLQRAYPPATQLTIDLFARPATELSRPISGTNEFVVAASALIQRNAKLVWPYFCDLRDRDEKLATDILKTTLETVSFGEAAFVRQLSEAQLAELYVWLARHIPPPIEREDGGWVGFEDRIEQLRNFILNNLISRGTAEAVAAVQEISNELPESEWLRWRVVDAKREVTANSWKRLDPAEVIAVVASFRPLPNVRSTKETIRRAGAVAQQIGNSPPAGTLLTSLGSGLN